VSDQEAEAWMWERARGILERAHKLERQFFELRRSRYLRPTWEPPVDVFVTEDELWILVALPGVAPEKLEVLIDGGILVVTGERALPPECRRAAVQRLEIPHGRFERQIELPAGRFEIGIRDLRDGCLVLNLRKAV
jgi:HSP20 family protein